MARNTSDTPGLAPYRTFRFVVRWEGRPVAGISSVSGLSRPTELVEHREGADPVTTRVSPRPTQVGPVTLQRGVTHDAAFAAWANSSPATRANSIVRKNLYVALFNEAGQQVTGYNLYLCWPSEFEAMSDLDTDGIVIQRLVLQLEGWEQDSRITEPASTTGSPPVS